MSQALASEWRLLAGYWCTIVLLAGVWLILTDFLGELGLALLTVAAPFYAYYAYPDIRPERRALHVILAAAANGMGAFILCGFFKLKAVHFVPEMGLLFGAVFCLVSMCLLRFGMCLARRRYGEFTGRRRMMITGDSFQFLSAGHSDQGSANATRGDSTLDSP